MMHPDDLRPRLKSVLAFPVTPFTDGGDMDLEGFRANLRFLEAAGLTGVVVAGGTGELYSLTPDECRALYRDGLYAYYRAVAEATALGVFPYARGQAIPTPDLLARLAELPNVVAFKDGNGDLRLWARLRERVGVERLVWLGGMGDDLAPPYFAAGAEGFTSSVANYDPQTALDLFALVSRGQYAEADRLLRERGVYAAYDLRARRKGHEVSVVKAAMELAGLPTGPVRPPLLPLSPAEREELARIMRGARQATLATTA